MPKKMKDLTGERFGRLVVLSQAPDGFDKKGSRQRYWNCICDCGAEKVVRGPNLTYKGVRSCGCLLRDTNSLKRLDALSYVSFHQRLRRDQGHASKRECVDCGQPAHEWSYDGLDPNDLPHERGEGIRYSLKPEHYHPRCRPCHRSHDHNARREDRLVGF